MIQYSQFVGFFCTMKTISEQIKPEIIQKAKKLALITQFLHPALPAECLPHVRVAGIRQGTLVLVTDSPVWTTRLRQLSAQILQYIHDNNQQFTACLYQPDATTRNSRIVHHLQIKTRFQQDTKPLHPVRTSPKQKRHISKKTADLLTQSANYIGDEQLKSALKRLARHHDTF